MRNAPLLLLATSLALPAVNGLTLLENDSPAVVALDIQRKDAPDPVGRDRLRRKRDKIVSQALNNEETLYYCNLTLGTPAQSFRLVLDTGSSDLWCNVPNSQLCSSPGDPCSSSGTYDSKASSTYAFVSSNFNIKYADGSGAVGDYVTDILHIGGTTIKDFQFGLGYLSGSAESVLGIGYTSNEGYVGHNEDTPYPNLPQAMVQKGLIRSNAYSLWLNDLGANTGSILFGGVNTAKYHGKLETLPIQRVHGVYSQVVVALTGVAVIASSGHHQFSSSALPAAVLLDSGSSLTYLPDPIVRDIYDALAVTYKASSGVGYVPCRLAKESIDVSYTFSSPSITVGIAELVLDAGNLHFQDGTRACVFGIAPAGNTVAVLGDTFLRSAYVVYDLANNEISLANTNFNANGDKIMEIGTGTDAVPGATPVANPVTTVAPIASGSRIGGPAGSNIFASPIPVTKSGNGAAAPTRMPRHLALGLAGAGCLLAL